MTRIISRHLIKHLEWDSQQPPPPPPSPIPNPPQGNLSQFSIDDILLRGNTSYSEEKNSSGLYIGVAVALEQAFGSATPEGIVATMPELLAAKIKAEKSHDFWKKWYTVHTEENIGIDKKGTFYSKDEPVLVVVNGGGLLTPARIRKAYDEGLLNNSAKYTPEEFDNLLEGNLPDGKTIPFYTLEDLQKGISNLPHQFGVVMPYKLAQETSSGYHNKKSFLENPLAQARSGNLELLEPYYEKAKDSSGNLGNWHPFSGRDPSIPQGRLLCLSSTDGGLYGDVNLVGRLVGVAPEAHSAKK